MLGSKIKKNFFTSHFCYVISLLSVVLLVGCQTTETVKPRPVENKPQINKVAFMKQYQKVIEQSSALVSKNSTLYQCAAKWIESGADENRMVEFGLTTKTKFENDNNKALFTGYYSPVIKGREYKTGEFQYPLYAKPNLNKKNMPSRESIYNGALDGKGLELAYTNSRVDNFIMGVQGSGYVDFEDGRAPVYFAYSGQNGHKFKGVGKLLVEQGELTLENVSLKSIYEWTQTHSEAEVTELLNHNPSWVFFSPKGGSEVKGAANISLIGHGAVAADKSIFPFGSLVYAKVPDVNKQGKFTGMFKPRVYFVLDVGGAIKENHFDIYHGLGKEAGIEAGNNKFKGDAFELALVNDTANCL